MRIVLRLGGSVVASPMNPSLMGEYANLLQRLHDQEDDVVAVVGGGSLARELIQTAKEMKLDERVQDEIAISVSRICAKLLLEMLGENGSDIVPAEVDEVMTYLEKNKIVVMGGLRPGMTTDTVAALVAEKMRADLLVKATNQNGVYDSDPRMNPNAVKLDHLRYEQLSSVFQENKHKAGIHQVIDPEAIKILKRGRIRVVVVNGFEPENVSAAIKGKSVGTLID